VPIFEKQDSCYPIGQSNVLINLDNENLALPNCIVYYYYYYPTTSTTTEVLY